MTDWTPGLSQCCGRTLRRDGLVWKCESCSKCEIHPNPGPQTQLLRTTCYEVLFGGSAGGGKSLGIVLDPLRWIHLANYYAIIFRRETPQLSSLITKAASVYPRVTPGARFQSSSKKLNFPHWRFPAGAVLRYAHMQHESDKTAFQGDEPNELYFDELTHFEESQYRYLLGRVRSAEAGMPRYVRSTANPGGEGHDWVFARWGPWLDPEFEGSGLPTRYDTDGEKLPPAESGQVLWVLQTTEGEAYVPEGTPGALSRTFIASRLEDNPALMDADPLYEQKLLDNDPVTVRQLRFGDWLVRAAAGVLFRREWFPLLERPPEKWIARCRFWDRAATPVKLKAGRQTNDPDWTIGALVCWCEDGFVVEDVVRERQGPGDVWQTIKRTAESDGRRTIVGLEQEPGASGKFEADAYVSALPGFEVRPIIPSGSKVRRAGPASAQASARKISVVRRAWTEPFLRCLEAFPDGIHDDDADALSGALLVLTSLPLQRPVDWDRMPIA